MSANPSPPKRLVTQLSTRLAHAPGEQTITEVATTIQRLTKTLGEESITELLANAVDTLTQQKHEIAQLVENEQWDEASTLAHRMKGATAIYGGEHIATLLRRIEKREDGDTAIKKIAAELDAELDKAIAAIKASLNQGQHVGE